MIKRGSGAGELSWSFPDDLYYMPFDHEWARVEGDALRVGISSFIVWFMSRLLPIDWMRTVPAGRMVKKYQALGSYESPSYFTALRSPVAGEILEVNFEIVTGPQRIKEAPYEHWIFLIRPANGATDLRDLPHGGDAVKGWMSQVLAEMESVGEFD
ncbi:MAG: hypothetical protein HY903_14295 [Deltaproteobacteria bacterium]|nr:hypothetical protein [Deltaproteobacteria bacterium]